jgi:hypothetical protein
MRGGKPPSSAGSSYLWLSGRRDRRLIGSGETDGFDESKLILWALEPLVLANIVNTL